MGLSSESPSDEPALTEQLPRFDYDYRLRCPNGHLSHIPADEFHAQWTVEDGVVPCTDCGENIAVVNANIAVRNSDDPALDREHISELAWYHTSTYSEWPWPGYAAMVADQFKFSASTMPAKVFADMLRRAQTKALHLGTFESAIENMHRRMRNEADDDSQFYLHRVRVRLAAKEIHPDLRHESHESASQLTIDELEGFKAIRYINVEESPGSISLAIDPSAIASIQTVPLPVASFAVPSDTQVSDVADKLDAELAEIRTELGKLPSLGFVAEVKLRRAGDSRALCKAELNRRVREIFQSFNQLLEQTYLAHINPIVRERFMFLFGRPDGSAEQLHEVFRLQAGLLIRSADIIGELASQPPKAPRRPESGDG
jgi:hypothetical protein